jgi:hypothetical protein
MSRLERPEDLTRAMEKEMFDKHATNEDPQLPETRLKHDLTVRLGESMAAGFTTMPTASKRFTDRCSSR